MKGTQHASRANFAMPLMTPEERVGTTLGGKYRLARIMAEGGMGVVFAAEHVVTQRPLVVKLLRPDRDPQPADVARMFREARALAAFEHPNAVEVLDFEMCDGGTPYLVMPRLQGESLDERLRREAPLDPTTTLRWLLPVVGLVAYAHDAGVVHRDIKPGNIMLAHNPAGRITPKLIDFGIAKVLDGDPRITDTGIALGTAHYMSPEQAMGHSTTTAADVWALGVVLFQCLGAELPFRGDVPMEVMVNIVNRPARNLEEVAPQLPKQLTAVVHNCLIKDPKRRYRDARALAYALAVAAVRSGVQLPFEPDPIGLPDWRRWLTTARRPADWAGPRPRDTRGTSERVTSEMATTDRTLAVSRQRVRTRSPPVEPLASGPRAPSASASPAAGLARATGDGEQGALVSQQIHADTTPGQGGLRSAKGMRRQTSPLRGGGSPPHRLRRLAVIAVVLGVALVWAYRVGTEPGQRSAVVASSPVEGARGSATSHSQTLTRGHASTQPGRRGAAPEASPNEWRAPARITSPSNAVAETRAAMRAAEATLVAAGKQLSVGPEPSSSVQSSTSPRTQQSDRPADGSAGREPLAAGARSS
ncbi:MAG: serine/threonine-protein kinase, partial [Myxococcales bacterium]|nr:serine/threonine-protein kinase [Myxococcales bacterium]